MKMMMNWCLFCGGDCDGWRLTTDIRYLPCSLRDVSLWGDVGPSLFDVMGWLVACGVFRVRLVVGGFVAAVVFLGGWCG